MTHGPPAIESSNDAMPRPPRRRTPPISGNGSGRAMTAERRRRTHNASICAGRRRSRGQTAPISPPTPLARPTGRAQAARTAVKGRRPRMAYPTGGQEHGSLTEEHQHRKSKPCRPIGRSGNIKTNNHRREVGPVQAVAVGPVQVVVPTLGDLLEPLLARVLARRASSRLRQTTNRRRVSP